MQSARGQPSRENQTGKSPSSPGRFTQRSVNRKVQGSNPCSGAKPNSKMALAQGPFAALTTTALQPVVASATSPPECESASRAFHTSDAEVESPPETRRRSALKLKP
jgi:hypothetical protein